MSRKSRDISRLESALTHEWQKAVAIASDAGRSPKWVSKMIRAYLSDVCEWKRMKKGGDYYYRLKEGVEKKIY